MYVHRNSVVLKNFDQNDIIIFLGKLLYFLRTYQYKIIFNNDISIFVLHDIGSSGTSGPPNMSGNYNRIICKKKISNLL